MTARTTWGACGLSIQALLLWPNTLGLSAICCVLTLGRFAETSSMCTLVGTLGDEITDYITPTGQTEWDKELLQSPVQTHGGDFVSEIRSSRRFSYCLVLDKHFIL